MTRVIRVAVFTLAAVVSALNLAAQESKPPTAALSPTGSWDFVVDSPHGKMTMSLDIKADAAGKVTGVLSGEQLGKLNVAGKFADSRLTFAVTGGNVELSFAGKMKDANTLLGTLTGHGDVACTATRAKGK